ncbi:hypothetical protein ACLIKD_10020 [Azonexus sp. IMCC34842]|uniref:hypothetical protein n=1 Tax=Azonexus sp. IMCC34842 TaxID=3420950 RepID=UPI003D0A335F
MSRKNWLALLAATLALLLSGLSAATEVTIFETCQDGRGQTLPAVADEQQAMLVRTVTERGRAVIRYNPEVLPRLTPAARLFFYAHQCARHGLGEADQTIPVTRARQADCIGLNTLLADKMLTYPDLPALQAALSFNDTEWELLPGPPRSFDLANCRATARGVLHLPSVDQPSARQTAWNNCVRACADRLWTCQKHCAGASCDSCLTANGQCKASCGSPPDSGETR